EARLVAATIAAGRHPDGRGRCRRRVPGVEADPERQALRSARL
ncbi:MAG: hypothetical protein AVDCRST_MAG76-2644, partial [uncultured Acidimicrobiales bacterium]